MDGSDIANNGGVVTILVTTIAGFLYQAWRAERQRKWDIEDRRLLAEKVVETATVVAEQRKDMGDAIAENTKLTKAATVAAGMAFQEANEVNNKISELTSQNNELQKDFTEEIKNRNSQ